jgi:sugar phosphate isomerase/epimerase
MSRRTFLAGTGYVCGGVMLASQMGRTAFADKKHTHWPVTCRDSMLPPMRQKNCWTALQAVGAEGVEIAVADDFTLPGLLHPSIQYTVATDSGVEQLAADAKTAGQQITAFCMFNRFEERPDFEILACKKLARVAQLLGVSAIRIDVVPNKLDRPKFLALAIDTLKKIIAATETTGVNFGVENHSNTTNDPGFLLPLFDGVGSKRLGLTLDTGNFYWYGHPLSKVYELVETFAPRVFHTHCKSIRYPIAEREKQRPMGWRYTDFFRPLYEGDIDYDRVAAILQKAGYHNDLCVEDEYIGTLSATEATATLAKDVAWLKRARDAVANP